MKEKMKNLQKLKSSKSQKSQKFPFFEPFNWLHRTRPLANVMEYSRAHGGLLAFMQNFSSKFLLLFSSFFLSFCSFLKA